MASDYEEYLEEDDSKLIETYGGCVCENQMIKLQTQYKKNEIPKYIVNISMYGERHARKMAKIETWDGLRYADIITGSLYDPNTGKCNSPEIRIINVRKDIPETKKKTTKAKK